MRHKWGPLLIALGLAVMFAIMSVMPPKPQGLNTTLDQFSSARAMIDVRIIAQAPHPTGSEENAKVRSYLENRLTELGLEVKTNTYQLKGKPLSRLNKWSGENKTEQPIYNIVGLLRAEDSSKGALLLMAHHDTVWGSPGAADDTVGIASILEIVRAVKETGDRKRDLIVLFTDAEEVGLVGATRFFNENPLRDKIGGVINFEARGGGGTANMFQTSAQNGHAARLYARAVREPNTSSLSTFVYSILPNDTDLTPALEKDYVAYNIANLGAAEYYHSPKIDAKALDERTLQHMGSQGLDLTRALLSSREFPAKKRDATFFDLFGLVTIIYAPFLGWIFLLGATICYGVSVRGNAHSKEILQGGFKMVGFFALGGLGLYGLNALSGKTGYYDRLAAIPKLEWLALGLCFAAFFAVYGRKAISVNEGLGAAIPIFILGIIVQALAPTASYFITLPLMLCAVASLAKYKWSDNIMGSIIAVVAAALVLGYMLGLNHLLIQGVGPDMLAVAIVPAALGILAIMPLLKAMPKPMAYSMSVAGLVFAIGIALWIRLDPIASTVPLY